jgi:hypothetical protein
VARQEEDCRALCERLGWNVARAYVDNDVSAYSGKPRPQWDELRADIDVGLIDAVVCWHVDRLTRSPRELEEVIDLHDKRGVQVAAVTGEIDLSATTGRMLGAAARHEAEHKAERQRRALLTARPGTPRASSRRYLLSGILTCGRCGQGRYARPHENGARPYVCVKEPGTSGCGIITIMAAPADDEVRGRVLAALDTPEFLAALLAAAAAGGTDADDISGQLRSIDGRRDELAAELSRTQHGRALARFATLTGTVWDRWDNQMTTGARRALIQAVTAGIPVHPATTRRWNPDRIRHPGGGRPSHPPPGPQGPRPADRAPAASSWRLTT